MNIRHIIATVPLLAAGALLLPAPATAAPSAGTATPRALSLSLKDVQHVYGNTFRPFMANTYKASRKGTCGANYTGGYLTIFGNFQKATKAGGVVSIESTVFAYTTSSSAACASKLRGASMTRLLGRSGTTIHASPLSGVGDSAYLFTATSTIGSATKHAYTVMIMLSRGTHTAMVMVSAVGSPPAQSGAIALAKVVDGRIQAAG